MNIFYLNRDPKLAAQAQCDKHVVKMILETAQLLCTAHRVLDQIDHIDAFGYGYDYHKVELYKATHVNHPCAIWARESVENYHWLFLHFLALCDEYYFRYGKKHKTHEKYWWHLGVFPKNIPVNIKRTDPPQCMPDEYKRSDTVEAYRAYYIGAKSNIARWNRSEPPHWWPLKMEN